jgi:exo-beta-1,3-glucanase (GH17 family)
MIPATLIPFLATTAFAATPVEALGKTKSINGDKPFFGLTYNPFRYNADCQGAANIREDLKILSDYTNSIRTYSLGCNQDIIILQEATKQKMDVTLGMWVDQWTTFDFQLDLLKEVIKETTPKEQASLKSIVVGNESIFRGEQNSTTLAAKIQTVRTYLKSVGLERVSLTTAEIKRDYDQVLVDAVDYLLPNLHIFFDNYDVSIAPEWFFHKYFDMSGQTEKEVVIGEVGWPSGGDPFSFSPKSVPSVDNAKFVLNSLLCEANSFKVKYFYFDAFNADWKFGAPNSEFNWGIGGSDRKMKDWVDEALICTPESYKFQRISVCAWTPFDDRYETCVDGKLIKK